MVSRVSAAEPGILPLNAAVAGAPVTDKEAKGVRRIDPAAGQHEKVWGIKGIPLESPYIVAHMGATARKHDWRGGRSFLQVVGRASYFGLLQSVKMIVVTGGCATAPRTLFCVLKV